MIKSKIVALALATALGLGMAAAAQAQTARSSINTGDAWLDGRMGEVDSYGRRHRDPFVTEVVTLGAPRSLVVDLLDTRGWSPGDIYMACSIANVVGVGCARVVERYEASPGRGWGRIAQDMGIKPGSPEFHALKRGTVSTYNRWGYPIEIDSRTRVDWSDGPRGRGHSASGASRERGHQGPGNQGQGNQGQGNRGPGSQGQGQGNRNRGNSDENPRRGRGNRGD
jgi:hypothetical protein